MRFRLRLLWARYLNFTARRLRRKSERLAVRSRACTDMALDHLEALSRAE